MWHHCATVALVSSTPGRRYAKLVEAMGEALGHSYGWQAEVARKLGVTRSFISRIAGGVRFKARAQTIERAVYSSGLPSSFFYGEAEPTREQYQKAAMREPGRRRRPLPPQPEVPQVDELSRRAALLLDRVDLPLGPDDPAVVEMTEIAELVLELPLPRSALAFLDASEDAQRRTAFQRLCLELYRATLPKSGTVS